jgi:hypothetical protein
LSSVIRNIGKSGKDKKKSQTQQAATGIRAGFFQNRKAFPVYLKYCYL